MCRAIIPLALFILVAPLRADEPKDVIARAVKAHGGAANLERMTASRLAYDAVPSNYPTVTSATAVWYSEGTNRLKLVGRTTTNDGQMDSLYVMRDGKAWQKFTGLAQIDAEVTGTAHTHLASLLQEGYARNLLPLLRDAQFTLSFLPESTVRGRPAIGIQAKYPDKPDVCLWFDRETHLLIKSAFPTALAKPGDPNPNRSMQETYYEDYREPIAHEERLLEQAGLKADAASLSAFLAKHKPDPAAAARAVALVKQLADESFVVREKASEELVALGPPAVAALKTAAQDDDLEVSRRARACLEKIQVRTQPETTMTAIRLLALRAPDGAAETLLDLLPGVDGAVAEEVMAALAALAERPGGPPAVLVRALEDRDEKRREAARAVLGKDEGVYLNRPDRRLLLTGVRLPYRWIMGRDGQTEWVLNMHDLRFVNRFADKEFDKP
jgi:hypothetical protein